jgi:lipopolysaccharide transport system ATP-binding protein
LHSGDSDLSIGRRLQTEEKKQAHGYAQIDSGEVKILSFQVCNMNDEEIVSITSEGKVKIKYSIETLRDLEDPHYGISIRNKFGISVFNTNTYCMGIKNRPLKKGDTVTVRFEMTLNVAADVYSICIGVANIGFDKGSFKEYLLNYLDVGAIKVLENLASIKYGGFFNMNPIVLLEY